MIRLMGVYKLTNALVWIAWHVQQWSYRMEDVVTKWQLHAVRRAHGRSPERVDDWMSRSDLRREASRVRGI